MKLDFFDNPFTAEKFEYSSKPIKIQVVQNDSEVKDRVTSIFSGDNHSLALTEMGCLWSWGLGTKG